MIVIGLSGLAGSGKDIVADQLVNHHGFVKLEENLLVKELARRYNAALRQRDELLAALKSVNESAVCFAKNEYSISADAISKVENAIAGVKGGAE